MFYHIKCFITLNMIILGQEISTHGHIHPLYQVWTAMKNRCCNKKHQSYKNYGGREFLFVMIGSILRKFLWNGH